MFKAVAVIFIPLFILSCAVVPVTRPHSEQDSSCDLSTHKWDLDLIQVGHYSASCSSPECVLATGLGAVVIVGVTAIVSGSIVLVGNAVHWVEQQGRCDAKEREQTLGNINNPLIQQGGKPVKTKQQLEKELEER